MANDNRARHAFGSSSSIEAAKQANKIDAYDILFLDGDTDNPKIGWLDAQGNTVICQDKNQIVRVDELPTMDGDENVVYIYNNECYIWNGNQCVSTCKPADLTELETEVAEIETQLKTKVGADEVEAKIKTATTDSVASANAYTDKMVEAAMGEHLTKKYEITSVPEGTLVDYRETEIRVMVPENSVFTKQDVGAGGDPNAYYMTFKTYQPSDDAVGYIEHLNGQSDSEILTDFSVDEYGRKYQPTWLALATYDAATDTWTYYGKNSTENKYTGFDYQIDWYNSNGVMIASDCVRINLSNEDCHYYIEPYYVGSMMSEIDTKIEKKVAEVNSAYEIVEF